MMRQQTTTTYARADYVRAADSVLAIYQDRLARTLQSVYLAGFMLAAISLVLGFVTQGLFAYLLGSLVLGTLLAVVIHLAMGLLVHAYCTADKPAYRAILGVVIAALLLGFLCAAGLRVEMLLTQKRSLLVAICASGFMFVLETVVPGGLGSLLGAAYEGYTRARRWLEEAERFHQVIVRSPTPGDAWADFLYQLNKHIETLETEGGYVTPDQQDHIKSETTGKKELRDNILTAQPGRSTGSMDRPALAWRPDAVSRSNNGVAARQEREPMEERDEISHGG
jgi:hypothetical protein